MKKTSRLVYLLGLPFLIGISVLCVMSVVIGGNTRITIPSRNILQRPILNSLYLLGDEDISGHIVLNNGKLDVFNGLIMGENNAGSVESRFITIGGGSNNGIGLQPQPENLEESEGDSTGESEDEVVDSEESGIDEENSTDDEGDDEGDEEGDEVEGGDEIIVNNGVMVEESGIGGGKDNMIITSFSVIGGGKNNSAVSGSLNTIAGGSNNQAGEGGTVVGGDNNVANGMGIIIGGQGNRLTGDGMVLGSNSNGGIGSFSWNSSLTQNYSAIIMANNGVLVGTTDPIAGVNLVVSGAVKIGTTVTDENIGEIRMMSGCFYGYNGSWHVINKNPGVDCPDIKCSFGSLLLSENDKVMGYTQAYSEDCSSTQIELYCGSDGIIKSSSNGYSGDYYAYCHDLGKSECGVANGQEFTSKPDDYKLCGSGEPTEPILEGGMYRWTCNHLDKSVSCSARKVYSCGPDQPGGIGVKVGPSTYNNEEENLSWTYVDPSEQPGVCEWTCEEGYNRINGENDCAGEWQCKTYAGQKTMFSNVNSYHIARVMPANGSGQYKKLYRTYADALGHNCSYICTNGYEFLPATGGKPDRCAMCAYGTKQFDDDGNLIACSETMDICGSSNYTYDSQKGKCVAIGNCLWNKNIKNVIPANTDIKDQAGVTAARPIGQDLTWKCKTKDTKSNSMCQYYCKTGFICRYDTDNGGPGCAPVSCSPSGGKGTLTIDDPVTSDTWTNGIKGVYYKKRKRYSSSGMDDLRSKVGNQHGCFFGCPENRLCKLSSNRCSETEENNWVCYQYESDKQKNCVKRDCSGGTPGVANRCKGRVTLDGYITYDQTYYGDEDKQIATYAVVGAYDTHRGEKCWQGCSSAATSVIEYNGKKVCWKQCAEDEYFDITPNGGCKKCATNLLKPGTGVNDMVEGNSIRCVNKCGDGRTLCQDCGENGEEVCIPTEINAITVCPDGYSEYTRDDSEVICVSAPIEDTDECIEGVETTLEDGSIVCVVDSL